MLSLPKRFEKPFIENRFLYELQYRIAFSCGHSIGLSIVRFKRQRAEAQNGRSVQSSSESEVRR